MLKKAYSLLNYILKTDCKINQYICPSNILLQVELYILVKNNQFDTCFNQYFGQTFTNILDRNISLIKLVDLSNLYIECIYSQKVPKYITITFDN